MKKISLLLGAILIILLVGLYVRCTKINKDQPCGTYGSNEQLFKDSNNKCYYIDNSSGNKVYIDKSLCSCF
jgi:hypothetical protein